MPSQAEGALHITEAAVVHLAVRLGALRVGGSLTAAERDLADRARKQSPKPDDEAVEEARRLIQAGHDPLGELFCQLRPAATRRVDGAVYTPPALVAPMVQWILDHDPARIVDAGSGSGRFAASVARKAPDIPIVAVDLDPLATLMTRATLAVLEVKKSRVLQQSYTDLLLSGIRGRTAFVGNPPYVRHHQLSPEAKAWAQGAAAEFDLTISGLAGLHAHFFLATALAGRAGDIGCFVTSAEWLDVNYGAIIRNLLTGELGGDSIHILEPTAAPFEGTATTAAVTTFRIGAEPTSIRFRPVASLDDIGDLAGDAGEPVARQRLIEAPRWSPFVRTRNQVPDGYIELGELCRVHRGTVTGSNVTWVTRSGTDLPESVLFPSVTKARELFAAGEELTTLDGLRKVIDIPADLDVFNATDKKLIEKFLKRARNAAVHKGYIAAHRRAWWTVGLRKPAPILATYMARRPPAFVCNTAEARHINIAHGLYPRQPIPDVALSRLATCLRDTITLGQGRTYAGGLVKFEPREMERIPVPDLGMLLAREHPAPAMVS